MSDDRPTCEDCRQPSDLGNKCRACYRRWQAQLYRDIPDRLAEFTEVALALNRQPQVTRKAIANTALGKPAGGSLAGKPADLVASCKRVLEGPYGPQLEMRLMAAISASPEKGAKSGGSDDVE